MALAGAAAGRAWRARLAWAALGVWAGPAAWGEHCLREKRGEEKRRVGGAPQPHWAPRGRPAGHTGPSTDLRHQRGFPSTHRTSKPPYSNSSHPHGDKPFSGLPAASPAPPVPVGEAQGTAGCRGCGWEAMAEPGLGLSGHGAGSAPGERRKREKRFGECPFTRALRPAGPSGRKPLPPATLCRGANPVPKPHVHLCRQPDSVPNRYHTANPLLAGTTLCTPAPARRHHRGTAQ